MTSPLPCRPSPSPSRHILFLRKKQQRLLFFFPMTSCWCCPTCGCLPYRSAAAEILEEGDKKRQRKRRGGEEGVAQTLGFWRIKVRWF
ncbi:hypothetical protein SETIT_6G150300v2 [Setaria italica]|uniref:Uncharacterized protein n=1 Tax=Setaria italica TaxID=4555 RepID=A0A368RLM9_SETIT|nr:hypothetical protein SETIT_6G150300v2 [Setaria italica]